MNCINPDEANHEIDRQIKFLEIELLNKLLSFKGDSQETFKIISSYPMALYCWCEYYWDKFWDYGVSFRSGWFEDIEKAKHYLTNRKAELGIE